MHQKKGVVCQYLKGSSEGVQCNVVNKLIRYIEGADIRLCMGKHYEVCAIYISLLREAAAKTLNCMEYNNSLINL